MKAYALEIDAYTGYSLTKLYFSSSPALITGATDTPADTAFSPRIIQPGNYSVQAFQDAMAWGKSQIGYGEIVLDNSDGALDALMDYGFDGRIATLRVREEDGETAAYPSEWHTVFTGTIELPEALWPGYNDSQIVLRMRDGGALLHVRLPLGVYLGDNVLPDGLEGTADDIKGKTKPLLLGKCFNMSLQCVNTSKLIYAVSPPAGGAVEYVYDFDSIADFDAEVFYFEVVSGPVTTDLGTEYRRGGCSTSGLEVYDSGVSLVYGGEYATVADLLAIAPSAGQYKVMPAYGYIRLGSSPAGEVTCTATDNNGHDANTAGSITRAILRDFLQWDSSRFNIDELAAIDAEVTTEIGHLITQDTYVDDLLDLIFNTAGACYYFDNDGVFRSFLLVDPTTRDTDFVLSTEIESIEFRSSTGIPPKLIRIKQQRNWTVQGSGLAGSVSADRRAWLSNEYRENISYSNDIAFKHLLSDELVIDSLFCEDAQLECDKRLSLYATKRSLFDLYINLDTFSNFYSVQIGQIAEIQLSGRYGCTAKKMLVTGIQTDLAIDRMILTVWG